ncbi:hypothetical protein Droror1_Dr00025869 [Drosera rotundifolia]
MSSFTFPPQPYPNPNPNPPNYPWNQAAMAHHPSPNPSSQQQQQGIGPATLLVRHLPEAIPVDTLSRLLSHYGASGVRLGNGARSRNCAFVDFQDEAMALQAQRQLNGLRFLGKVLSVTKANNPTRDVKEMKNEVVTISPSTPASKEAVRASKSIKGSVSGHLLADEPIAEKLGIDYPFPPQLEYAYPPPDGNILTNILNALIAVPRFYTQVLHLMNKMNIPAPFRMALPTPPLPAAVPSVPPPAIPPPPPLLESEKPDLASSWSNESEMESSEEDVNDGALVGKKRKKREDIVGPAVDKDVSHEAVGLKPSTLLPKEIPIIKKKNTVLQIKMAPKRLRSDETIVGTSKEPDNTEKELVIPFAAAEEIERHKLPLEELLSLPMFKNYTAGNPTNVLYIKNLAKGMVVDDIYYTFGSLFGSIDEAKSGLNVRLMQEGRMRGQAFVTFPTIELAHNALNLVNGYVFKGKPMIIQFGRSSSAKPS